MIDYSKTDKHDDSATDEKKLFLIPNINLNDVNNQYDLENPSNLGIIISNATAKWTDAQSNCSIENINLNVRPGQLVAVIGPVGAGKVCIQSMTIKSNR